MAQLRLPVRILPLLLLRTLCALSPPLYFPSPGAGPADGCSVLLDPVSGQLKVVQGWAPAAVAWANLTDGIRENGWAALELTTNEKYNDSIQAYAAGVAEATVSAQLVYMHWMNTMVSYCGPFTYQTNYCQKLKNYLEANLNWMEEQIEEAGMDSVYWYQVRLVLLQLKGLEDGYTGDTTIPGHTQAFSSYPGTIFSGDDFYVLSSGLVSLETTIGNSNSDLWKFIKADNSVLEWLRNIVANRLARTGEEWAAIFEKFNSGTGMVITADKTELLYQEGYWASYNVPYFQDIFNTSGLPALVQKYGDWFTYEKNPRARIFRRNQTLIRDMDSMIRLMSPPQNAENAIAARSDLNPANGTYPFGALHQRRHGATDVKVTSFEMMKNYSFLAASGPTWDDLPPFQWSSSPYCNIPHMGHPDLWKFSPIRVRWA
ncbi:hypothetical protein Chor_013045 [Crotalus horridus]